MANLIKTLALTGLVALAGCGPSEIITNRDLTGDGITDIALGNNRFISELHVGNANGTYTIFYRNVDNTVLNFFQNSEQGAYFFDGKKFRFAPKWDGKIPPENPVKYQNTEAP